MQEKSHARISTNNIPLNKEVIKLDKLGLMYFQIHKKLETIASPEGIVTRKQIFSCLGSNYHIKKDIRELIIKEMESNDFLKRVSSGFIKINGNTKEINKAMKKKIMELKKNNY